MPEKKYPDQGKLPEAERLLHGYARWFPCGAKSTVKTTQQNIVALIVMILRLLILIFLAFLLCTCAKEYSFEGGTLPPPVDTTRGPQPVDPVPVCPACTGNVAAGPDEWTFKSGNWKLCGKADTAIALGDRTTFTFFGPSTCATDTGMVITVYLSGDTLNRDRQNLHINRAAFYCYDRVTPSYIFMSQSSAAFSVIIESYVHSTGIAVGSFRGTVFRTNGAAASIDSGRFRVQLR